MRSEEEVKNLCHRECCKGILKDIVVVPCPDGCHAVCNHGCCFENAKEPSLHLDNLIAYRNFRLYFRHLLSSGVA
jgi:hypothetical protein